MNNEEGNFRLLIEKSFAFAGRVFFKTLARQILAFGCLLIVSGFLGMKDVFLYAIGVAFGVEDTELPSNQVDFYTWLGIALVIGAVAFEAGKSLFDSRKSRISDLKERRIKLKKEFDSMHDVDLVEEFLAVFFVRAEARDIKLVLGCTGKTEKVLALFLVGYPYVESNGNWFKASETFLKTRHIFGWIFLFLSSVFSVLTIILFAVSIYTHFEGNTSFPDLIGYGVLASLYVLTCLFLYSLNRRLGMAIELIENMRPEDAETNLTNN